MSSKCTPGECRTEETARNDNNVTYYCSGCGESWKEPIEDVEQQWEYGEEEDEIQTAELPDHIGVSPNP